MAPTGNLTKKDLNVLQGAWQCFDTMPKVDYQKLADVLGYKTAASATTAYCNAKKKLLGSASAPSTPKSGAAAEKKRKAITPTDDEDEFVTPVKGERASGKTGAKKMKFSMKMAEGEDSEMEGSCVGKLEESKVKTEVADDKEPEWNSLVDGARAYAGEGETSAPLV